MRPVERARLLEAIGVALQEQMNTSDINALLQSMGITDGLKESVQSKRLYAKQMLAKLGDVSLLELANDLNVPAWNRSADSPAQVAAEQFGIASTPDPRKVFVVHGRDQASRRAMFAFLRALGLEPLEWETVVRLTGQAAPFIGDVIEVGFAHAQAVVVILTPDDEARLRAEYWSPHEQDYEKDLIGQPRQNVLLEAGMALSSHRGRTILVQIGSLRPISDIGGRHLIRMSNSAEHRNAVAARLETAGCLVQRDGQDWLTEGTFPE